MTWIKTIPPDQADEKLKDAFRQRALYPKEYGVEVPALAEVGSAAKGENITGSHTLIPDALYHAFATFGSLMSPDLPLSRAQHEMIASVVSVTNECFY